MKRHVANTIQTGILEIIGIGIVLQKFRMRSPGETAEEAATRWRVVRRRSAHEAEFVQASTDVHRIL